MTHRLLILGGTAEALDLAAQAAARFGAALEVTSTLAGRTQSPRLPAGRVRMGGFGGVDGLAAFLRAERTDALIDATHPFAATISRHAAEACVIVGVARLALVRPRWRMVPGDNWRFVANNDDAAEAIAESGARRVFLTIGGRGLEPFARLADRCFLVRMIEPPTVPLPLAGDRLVLARGPFSVDAERTLMEAARIELVVSRASGGSATEAKLVAARDLGLPVILIERPRSPPGETVDGVEAALGWLAARFGG